MTQNAMPIVTDMRVIPVAGRDSMLLNLSGAHGPFFTRNVVLMTDNFGRVGIGEVPGGEKITQGLERTKEIVVGSRIGDYRNTLLSVKEGLAGQEEDVRGAQTFDLRTGVHVLTGLEAPLLDLLGQYLEVPVAALLGDGQVRKRVKVLGYLFYVADRLRTDRRRSVLLRSTRFVSLLETYHRLRRTVLKMPLLTTFLRKRFSN